MRRIGFVAFMMTALMTGGANAGCIGSSAFQTCNDSSGNSYTINRFGNTTMMNGYNAQTGSSWSQNSNTFGNTTTHNGTASNGNSWNSTETRMGNTRSIYGSDSQGNSFSKTCGPFGCY
jgi:hypothetical protein